MSERIGIEALQRAKEILGSQQALARVVGVKQPSVHHMLKDGKKVPIEWCPAIERATSEMGNPVYCHELRPDFFGAGAPA